MLLATLLAGGCGLIAKEDPMQPTLTSEQAAVRVDEHVNAAIGALVPPRTLTAGPKSTMPCDDPSDHGPKGRVTVEHRYTLPGADTTVLDGLVDYWTGHGYRVLRDERGRRLAEVAVEADDGYAVVATTNVVGEISVVGTSPCVWPQGDAPGR
ncbi:hypothetical protein F4553_000357 [Allocatelliglobosispora scoriae]|uniref:Uncharacterized protein n=1 Tax=Allocatelliglobosispora scoriae TaxID=643052 RepID=A0A841BI26_9ACTN|nr:hypothetical protein [Allocatelliglobosispora scoriae]MBB5866978.1 hypothetical protein [Allocatelliglobosispora scoriae]